MVAGNIKHMIHSGLQMQGTGTVNENCCYDYNDGKDYVVLRPQGICESIQP